MAAIYIFFLSLPLINELHHQIFLLMKFPNYFLFLFIALLTACKKHTATPAVDQLPPETQKGANTFGCLVNGKVFKPGGLSLTPTLQCYYENLYGTNNPGYFFGLDAIDHSNPQNYPYIGIFADSIKIKNLGVIPLTRRHVNGEAFGDYGKYITRINPTHYITNNIFRGELNIKKIDSIQQIIAGTFWFNAVSEKGDTVKITDGRFDMHYTR